MMKKVVRSLLVLSLILLPMSAMADLGQVVTSKDIEISMLGAVQVLPHFMDNVDFNSKKTALDLIGDEGGNMTEHNVRTEVRVGWKATAKDWDFLLILEADFLYNKVNVDRQTGVQSLGNRANTDTFGVEKINFGYDFGPFKLNTGWNTKFVDLMTGGLIYADDHPYIGLAGKFGAKNNWEFLYITIQDDTSNAGGFLDGDTLDWRAYTLRVGFDVNGFTLAPIYAYSDNTAMEADVHYLGIEGYGTKGIFTPRFELVYAVGEKDVLRAGRITSYDINAWAAFASLDVAISKALVPYFGGYYQSGDDDKNDTDIEAYNGITMNSRYAPTFGMPNAFIYRTIPALGSVIYANGFDLLGTAGSGYGGISNSSRGDNTGMMMLGAGLKGAINEKLSYKTQILYFRLAEADNFKKLGSTTQSIDEEVGWEFDLQMTYKFNSHFSLGNVVSVFLPGDSVEDRLGPDYDSVAFLNTVEMVWTF